MKSKNRYKDRLHEIIFEADTPAGRWFDVILLILILSSIGVVFLDSMPTFSSEHKSTLWALEWGFTILFTVEYFFRLYSVHRPIKYATSFFGIIDLISILPTYISLFFAGTQTLIVIRALRLLRVFRIFQLTNYTTQGQEIVNALLRSRTKITVFIIFILIMVTIIGSVMYLVEASVNPGFDSIPRSIYWTIVTLTTVGYGDITPVTDLGQFLSAFIMLLGYSIIAVPTGIVSGEFMRNAWTKSSDAHSNTITCRSCAAEGHDSDAKYCKYCGEKL